MLINPVAALCNPIQVVWSNSLDIMACCDLEVLMYVIGLEFHVPNFVCEHQNYQPPLLTWQPLHESYVCCTGRCLASSFAGWC